MDKTTTLPARRIYLNFTEEEAQNFEKLIHLYRRAITNKRILMKPHFQDFDKTKQGYISKNQFLRILHQFGVFPDDYSLNLILKKYIDKGNLEEINYADFCRDVDVFDEGIEISKDHADAFKTFKKNVQNSPQTVLGDVPQDIEDLIAKLRKKTREFRIRFYIYIEISLNFLILFFY